MNGLDFIENRIKSLIQKSSVFFPWADKNIEIMSRLVDRIQNHLLNSERQNKDIPYVYTVKMNTNNAAVWQKNQSWHTDLAAAYTAILNEYGIKQDFPPTFNLVIKNSLEDNEFLIEEDPAINQKDQTSSITSWKKKVDQQVTHSPILLFGENKEIKISSTVITLGRRNTNDIVIDDMRISRLHAQIRHVSDGYIIFDAGSTGGTYVNNTRISQQKLQTGDVISLGGYKFIFLSENINGSTTPLQQNSLAEDN